MWISLSRQEALKLRRVLERTSFTPARNIGVIQKLRDTLDVALKEDKNPALRAYRERAKKEKARDCELEIDDDAVVSPGDDPGAYVMAWVWLEDADEDDKHG